MRMAREDGEFELILGNKQLLSVLFIIIVLLGVFFAMGFLAGRSTSPTLAGTAKPPSGQPLVVEPETKSPPAPEPKATPKEPPAEPPKEIAKAEPPRVEPPKAEAPKAEPSKPAPPKPEPSRPAPRTGGGGFVETPPSGTYIQVAATRRPDAETLIGQLGRQGMSGYITPSPKSPDLMRVIVGPLGEAKEIADTREKLKGLGITGGIIVKYK
jgi:cell division septation protein DedD